MGKKYSAGTAALLCSGDVVLPRTDDPPYFAMLQWRNCFFCANLLTKASFSHFRRGHCHHVWVIFNLSSRTESPVVGTFALVAATGGGQCGFVGDEYESESECCCYSIIVVAGGRIFIMCCESIIIVIIGGNIV